MPQHAADAGTPPWRVDAPTDDGPLPSDADVVVVGAGFTGLSTALHCARGGARVVLLEATTPGAGASGRTGGMVLEGTADGPLPGVERCLAALAHVVGREGIVCDLRLAGCIRIAHRAPAADAVIRWTDLDRPLTSVGAEPGGTIDPGALVAGLVVAARRAGATVHAHAPVTALEDDPVVHTTRGSVRARHVVVAVNAWLSRLLGLPVRSALTLAVRTAPLDAARLADLGLDDGRGFYTLDLPYLWGRACADRTLVVGSGLAWGDDPGAIGLGHADAAAAMERLTARIPRLHPALAGVRLTHRWGGPIGFPPLAVPVLGPMPGRPWLLAAGGCTGHGIALGVRMGQLLADAVLAARPLPAWGRVPDAGNVQ